MPSEADLDRFAGSGISCPSCGSEVYDDASQCHTCGYVIMDEARNGGPTKWITVSAGVVLVAFILWVTIL